MTRVGVPEQLKPELLNGFPAEAEIVRLSPLLQQTEEIEFWIPPLYEKPARAIYEKLSGIKVVQGLWAGVDFLVDMLPPDVILCDSRGAHDVATSEWAVTALLALLKYLPLYGRVQQSRSWTDRKQGDDFYRSFHNVAEASYPPILCEELADKTVLIVGYGSIGAAIEARLVPFNVKILRIARTARQKVEPVSKLHELLPLADAVVLILPLTKETTGLIGAAELKLMKHGCSLVNAARGPVLDTLALTAALHEGRIRAAVDVTDPEPLPPEHPLWTAPNILITPHIAGSSPRFLERPMRFAQAQVARYIRGEQLENIVANGY
jgi:phosphoglycerate dehydrogenase-like enzyme